MVILPPLGIASFEFTARFITTCSIWPASARVRPKSFAKRVCSSIFSPISGRSSRSMSRTIVDIFGNHFKNLLSNLGAGDGSTTQPDRDGIAILALPADLDVLQPRATAKFIDEARVFLRIGKHVKLGIEGQDFFN